MTTKQFQELIYQAYNGRGSRKRDVVEAGAMLQCEAAELSETLLKNWWYDRPYDRKELVSEAGDILNFLTYILDRHGIKLDECMEDNIKKLREREKVD